VNKKIRKKISSETRIQNKVAEMRSICGLFCLLAAFLLANSGWYYE